MEILEDLWYGRLDPIAHENDNQREYQELSNLYERSEKILRGTLNPNQQEDLQKMKDIRQEMEDMSECSAFITGFRLAVRMMAASI